MIFMSVGYSSQEQLGGKVIIIVFIIIGDVDVYIDFCHHSADDGNGYKVIIMNCICCPLYGKQILIP